MPNQINRDIYVLSSKVKDPIDYVRLTNDIPIVFTFRDYDIPSGSAAQVYVQKPSGKAVYDTAAISGNVVTVTVTDQMFAELGVSDLQIRLTQGDEKLVSFSQPVRVHPNYTEGDAQQSQNEGGFFDDADKTLQEVTEAAQTANQAAQAANQAAENANDAAQTANEAAENVGESIQTEVGNYFNENPIQLDDPVLDGNTLKFIVSTTPSLDNTTLKFIAGSSPSATLEQDVTNLKTFARQFDDKTLYTT